jgi:GNAT superfamily N-acetyltransferase
MTAAVDDDRADDDSGAVRIPDDGEPGDWIGDGPIAAWRRGPYTVSTDQACLDLDLTTEFLAATYWATDIPERVVRRALDHSIGFGLYEADRQIGFARVVTDRATFAWVGDVFVLDSHRGRGLGLWLTRCVLAHPELRELRRWMLASTTARGLYAKLGFTPLGAPERFMEIADPAVHRRQRARETGSDADT